MLHPVWSRGQRISLLQGCVILSGFTTVDVHWFSGDIEFAGGEPASAGVPVPGLPHSGQCALEPD